MELGLSLDYDPHYGIKGVWFRSYTTSEIRSLSVKEVTNPDVFDNLLQPTYGGLYDPAFGPSDYYDVCMTCGLGKMQCPGHMGHIELPMPVFNPVLFQTLYRMLKATCFSCNRLMVDPGPASLFVNQCKMLEYGDIASVGDLEEMYAQMTQTENQTNKATLYREFAEAAEALLKEKTTIIDIPVKNIEGVRQELVRSFERLHMKSQKKCVHCKEQVPNVREENKAKLILVGKGGKNVNTSTKDKDTTHGNDNDNGGEDDEGFSEDDESIPVTPGKRKNQSIKETPNKSFKREVVLLTALMVREHLYAVWKEDGEILKHVYPTLASSPSPQPMDMFFLEALPVPPSKFRPLLRMGDKQFENPQTSSLGKVVKDNAIIREILWEIEKSSATTVITKAHAKSYTFAGVMGKTLVEKLNNAMITQQTSINCVVDGNLDKSRELKPGLKQLLEKKEGLLRKNMMGKRVNFAARSVISPDPNINTYEIGIPMVFATALTYPQPVTPWNVHELRQAVMNGPSKHPGAFQVINEDGSVTLLKKTDATQREAVAKQLLTPMTLHGKQVMGTKKVLRHLKNGDVLLINRQPTLHKPSIQAHQARVLPGEKTLRLHYANCKAYNADFDGDEMNAHFPQSELARAEAYNIVTTDQQYLVPKDGTPLAGLIQDHMVSGVSLTIRGRMFNRSDYCRLVYTALVDKRGPVKLLPPCILKPFKLWSGKQVLSTVVLNILPQGKPALSMTGKSKVPEKSWIKVEAGNVLGEAIQHMGESDVIIRHGELLCGVLDKGHYGPTPYGLVHSCYELYGGYVAGNILTCFGRLFLNFLQWKGFTLGVEDILVRAKADKRRRKIIQASPKTGQGAACKALGLEQGTDGEALDNALKAAHFNKEENQMRELDMAMRNETNQIQNDIVNSCMPKGLVKLFPDNNLQLMVVSGAKGSSVNCMQISCLLGQIELEGKRPPLMMSGRTLPAFLPYDVRPRAGGFVTGRFLTGIRQPEYFFHCMAGREGLVDTAVKTSRSGYLQRCLIKHLEGVKVNYDLTVRDSDSSVVQFYYGEDSLDICKNSFIEPKQFPFLIENHQISKSSSHSSKKTDKAISKLEKKIKKWYSKNGQLRTSGNKKVRQSGFLHFCEIMQDEKLDIPDDKYAFNSALGEVPRNKSNNNLRKAQDREKWKGVPGRSERDKMLCSIWQQLETSNRYSYDKACLKCPDPVLTQYSPYNNGALPEKVAFIIQQYAKKNLKNVCPEVSSSQFLELMDRKLKQTIVEPGEAVGLLCAQSIGEPSTQMTLNTFHFAGRGEMNVTLGIPRLREILMVGSRNIKTPAMDVPIAVGERAKEKAKQLQKRFTKVYLNEVLQDLQVKEWLDIKGKGKMQRRRVFAVKFTFLPKECYKEKFDIKPDQIIRFMEKTCVKKILHIIKNKIRTVTKARFLSHGTMKNQANTGAEESHLNKSNADIDTGVGDDDISDDNEGDDGGNEVDKQRKRRLDEHDYDDEMDEEDDEDKMENVTNNMEDDDIDMDGDLEETENIDEMLIEEYEDRESPDRNENDDMNTRDSPVKKQKENMNARINGVLQSAPEVEAYSYDVKKKLWCEITYSFPLQDSKLDLLSLLENQMKTIVVHQVENISRCFLNEEKGENGMEFHLKTEGINMQELYKNTEVLLLDRLYSNDIHAMADTYGIEAANKVIIKEIQSVFAAYGIVVDYRHLSLLADYMTFEGVYKPFNRAAMETNPSPIQKMSFETTMNFLINASLAHRRDSLQSPSAQLVVGKNVTCGTGSLDLFTPLSVC